MAKVPPQFQKKPVSTNKKPSGYAGSPQNRTPIDAPNAGQDEALAVTRNALTGAKKAPPKGMPKGKLC